MFIFTLQVKINHMMKLQRHMFILELGVDMNTYFVSFLKTA